VGKTVEEGHFLKLTRTALKKGIYLILERGNSDLLADLQGVLGVFLQRQWEQDRDGQRATYLVLRGVNSYIREGLHGQGRKWGEPSKKTEAKTSFT